MGVQDSITPAMSQRLAELLPVTVPEGRTDLANARRFALVHRDKARYCSSLGRWLVWDGRRWSQDGGLVERLAKTVADWVWTQGAGSSEARRFAVQSASVRGIRATIALAKSEAGVGVDVDALDNDPYLLNVVNGTIDLKTLELREHRPADMITQLCPTSYDPNTRSRLWLQFLGEVLGGDLDLQFFVRKFLGYCLTGDVREQVMPIFWGDGANGKSTLVNAVIDVLGQDYAMQAVPEMLLETKQTRHRTERADLLGKRLVSVAETGHGARLNEALVKQLTGGERIRANKMYHDNTEFRPTHKFILSTNNKPRIRGTDFGIWRRLPLVSFKQQFKGKADDQKLLAKLRSDAVGILSALVDDCALWQREGLEPPDSVKAESAAYQRDELPLARFVAKCCVEGATHQVKFADFYKRLKAFCAGDGCACPSERETGAWLKTRYKDGKSSVRTYTGIGLQHLAGNCA